MADRDHLQLAPEASGRDVWLDTGRQLARQRSEESWLFADWIRDGVELMGTEAVGIAMEMTGASAGKISHYLTTSRTYPYLRRRKSLTFSHHMEAARLPEELREGLLDAAEAGSWSRAELREAVREKGLEAENERLQRRVRQLEVQLRTERLDPAAALEVTRRVETVVADITRRVLADYAEISRYIRDWRSTASPALHGNARRAAIRRIVKKLTDTAERIERMADDELGPALSDGPDQ